MTDIQVPAVQTIVTTKVTGTPTQQIPAVSAMAAAKMVNNPTQQLRATQIIVAAKLQTETPPLFWIIGIRGN